MDEMAGKIVSDIFGDVEELNKLERSLMNADELTSELQEQFISYVKSGNFSFVKLFFKHSTINPECATDLVENFHTDKIVELLRCQETPDVILICKLINQYQNVVDYGVILDFCIRDGIIFDLLNCEELLTDGKDILGYVTHKVPELMVDYARGLHNQIKAMVEKDDD